VKKICHINLLAILIIMPISLTCMQGNNLLDMSSVKNIIKKRYNTNPEKRKLFIKQFFLINDALHTRPDKFKDFYNTLQPTDRTRLIKTSGAFNSHGKKNAWYCPKITLALIDVYFQCNDLRNYIKSYCKEEKDKHLISSYLKKQLILHNNKQSSVFLSEWNDDSFCAMRKEIYLGSLFVNGGNTIKQDEYPIILNFNNKSYKTYAIHFGSDNYEYRITGIDEKQCLLWIINQKNQSIICSEPITFNDPIKGYNLSYTNNTIEYAVIYSDHEMIHATIDRENKLFEFTPVAIPKNNIVVNVCYSPLNNNWAVGLLDGMQLKYDIRWLWNNSIFSDAVASFFIDTHGLLKKIIISKLSSGCCMMILCGLANKRKIHSYTSNKNGNWIPSFSTDLKTIDEYKSIHNIDIINIDGNIEAFDLTTPFFINSNQGNKSWIPSFLDTKLDQSTPLSDKIHTLYSPNGLFLMGNFLKRKIGMSYVETVIKDPITHENLASFDTMSEDFIGVGFTPDGNNLIFIEHKSSYKKNLWNEQDTKMLNEFEKKAFSCSGVLSLLKSLCEECKEKGYVLVNKDDTIYTMLVDWSKESETMLNVLKRCLPVCIQEDTFMLTTKTSIYEKNF